MRDRNGENSQSGGCAYGTIWGRCGFFTSDDFAELVARMSAAKSRRGRASGATS
jgi:hypothetical protein